MTTISSDTHGGPAWVTKYRPNDFKEVVGNAEFVQRLQDMVQRRSLPNILLCGPPGCGKSVLLDCICASYEVMHLCAHEERGVDAARNKIRTFASREKRRAVVLDEIDGMVPGAQHSLQRVMESVGDSLVFMFACNDSERVIDVIQSRCAILRLNTADDEAMKQLAVRIADAEGMNITCDGINSLLLSSQGDLRMLVNNLQICRSRVSTDPVDANLVSEACDQPSPRTVWKVLELCAAGRLKEALVTMDSMWSQGHAVQDVLILLTALIRKSDLHNDVILRLLMMVNSAHINFGVISSRLQVAELFVNIAREVQQEQ